MSTFSSYLKKAAEDAEKKNKDTVTAKAASKAEEVMTDAELELALKEIDDKYKVVDENKLEGVKYDRIEYDAPTDAEIIKNAQDELAGYRAESISDIKTDTENRISDALGRKADSYRDLSETESGISGDYATAVRAYEDDMAKRGLSRSSIAASEKAAIEESRAEALASARSAHAEEISRIDAEISGLEADMQKALNAFDIAYAARLTERIAELTEEREEKRIEALKYNNQMTEKERDDMLAIMGDESLLEGEVPEDMLASYYSEKYDVFRQYLSGMSADQARVAVRNDPFIRSSLSDYFYYRLYNEFGA